MYVVSRDAKLGNREAEPSVELPPNSTLSVAQVVPRVADGSALAHRLSTELLLEDEATEHPVRIH
jgi:hypothetical protein